MIQDGFAERRNLIVISLAIIVYYWAGGSLDDESTIRLVLMNVKFHYPLVLFTFVWFLFLYFIFRYWVTSKSFGEESIRRKMHTEFHQLHINKKHHQHLLGELKKALPGLNIDTPFRYWTIEYKGNAIKFRVLEANGVAREVDVKGFKNRWILLKTMIRGYFKFAEVNAYYTPFILAWVAFFTLTINTYLKYCS